MFEKLLPRRIDNNYRGLWLATGFLALAMALPALQSYFVIRSTVVDITTADGIPLDKFSPDAVATVIGMATVMAIYKLILPIQSIIVLARYRSLIPFMLFTWLSTQIVIRVLKLWHPIPRVDAQTIARLHQPGDFFVPKSALYVGYVILGVTIVGLVLSLIDRADVRKSPTGPVHEELAV